MTSLRHAVLPLLLMGTFLLMNCRKNATDPMPLTGLDTTSHDVAWFIDTLGTEGSVRNVWTFSRDSAIAVGEIRTSQTDRQDSAGSWVYHYNIATWNGSNWILKRVFFSDAGTIVLISTIFDIYLHSANDIWLAGGSVFHWDGNATQAQTVFSRLQLSSQYGTIEKLWGSSNSDIHGIGASGSCVHFDGSSWKQLPSGTSVDLQDIWGLDTKHVWAAGSNIGDGHSVVLNYDGFKWSTIYDNQVQPVQTYFNFGSVWTYNSSILYLTGGSKLRFFQEGTYSQIETGAQYLAYRIRGCGVNDIFVTGQASEVAHYNGSSWHLYPELKIINDGFAWFYSVQSQKDFVLVGGLCLTSLNSYPVVLRGYR